VTEKGRKNVPNHVHWIIFLASLFSLLACARRIDEELRRAAIEGKVYAVEDLLGRGANVNMRKGGWTVLMFAAREGHAEIAKILLDNGADVNASGKEGWEWGGATALIIAAEKGHTEIIKIFLARGAKVNGKNNHGNTALMYAAEFGHPEVVKLLLASGADVTPKDKDGETALVTATRKGYTDIVQLLKNAGAKE